MDPDIRRKVALLSCNLREFFEERAGILEFEGGMSRGEAEQEAFELTVRFGELNG